MESVSYTLCAELSMINDCTLRYSHRPRGQVQYTFEAGIRCAVCGREEEETKREWSWTTDVFCCMTRYCKVKSVGEG